MIIDGTFRAIGGRKDKAPIIDFLFFESPSRVPYEFRDEYDPYDWTTEHHFGISFDEYAIIRDDKEEDLWHFRLKGVRMWDDTYADDYYGYFEEAVFDRVQLENDDDSEDWWENEPKIEMLSLIVQCRKKTYVFPKEALDGTWSCQYDMREHEKDYGPGNPWDAPGMSIRDFI